MGARGIPERITWAVGLIDVKPADRLLEIGCGRGVAVEQICPRLAGGTILGIDRSPTMIAAAEERNAVHIAAGRAAFRTEALVEADFAGARFGKVFAINVNAFWTRPQDDLAVVKRVLDRWGVLRLVYQPPTAAEVTTIADKLIDALEAGGFVIEAVVSEDGTEGPLLSVAASCAA